VQFVDKKTAYFAQSFCNHCGKKNTKTLKIIGVWYQNM